MLLNIIVNIIIQRFERSVRNETLKTLKNKFKTVNFSVFLLDSQLNRLIQNEQNTALSNLSILQNPRSFSSSTTSGTIFSADV